MRDDTRLAVSWRARPRSFLALMALYESNFLRLQALCGTVSQLRGCHLSRVPGDCDLSVVVEEQTPYTTTLTLTYQFEEPGPPLDGQPPMARVPDLNVRVYADARVAEARFREVAKPSGMKSGRAVAERELEQRWSANMLLNKWLEYCLERGHRIR
ncbi:MAG: hypothetical protein RL026_422 [Pseudomonadota bacterium]|jgi:uncharacterized protein YqiB (DUF1249 family)